MQGINTVLDKYKLPEKSERVTQEFQDFALHLAETLDDKAHKGLYMRLTKTTSRALLIQALSFVSDANARNKAALFMWKVKELKKL